MSYRPKDIEKGSPFAMRTRHPLVVLPANDPDFFCDPTGAQITPGSLPQKLFDPDDAAFMLPPGGPPPWNAGTLKSCGAVSNISANVHSDTNAWNFGKRIRFRITGFDENYTPQVDFITLNGDERRNQNAFTEQMFSYVTSIHVVEVNLDGGAFTDEEFEIGYGGGVSGGPVIGNNQLGGLARIPNPFPKAYYLQTNLAGHGLQPISFNAYQAFQSVALNGRGLDVVIGFDDTTLKFMSIAEGFFCSPDRTVEYLS